MKQLLFFLCLTLAAVSTGENVSQPAVAGNANPSPILVAQPSPVSPATANPMVQVAAPSAPPEWAQQLIVSAEKLPVVGPYVAKALLWLGIVSAILTTLVTALLGIANTLMGVANLSGLSNFSSWLSAFKDGKIMYWLKFFSLFNAQKPAASNAPPSVV